MSGNNLGIHRVLLLAMGMEKVGPLDQSSFAPFSSHPSLIHVWSTRFIMSVAICKRALQVNTNSLSSV